jgi:hypothetical protein
MNKFRFMTNKLVLLIMALALPLMSVGVASAHVLKEDNGISAVLHIDPDDDPIAAQPTPVGVAFSADGGFSLQDCNCYVHIVSDGQTIQTDAINPGEPGATLTAVSSVQFPKIGVYDLIVGGSAKDGKFPTFKLDYLERVATSADAPATSSSSNGSSVLIISAGSIVLLSMIGFTTIRRNGRYAPKAPATIKPIKKRSR